MRLVVASTRDRPPIPILCREKTARKGSIAGHRSVDRDAILSLHRQYGRPLHASYTWEELSRLYRLTSPARATFAHSTTSARPTRSLTDTGAPAAHSAMVEKVGETPVTCTMKIMEANSLVGAIYDRMPVLLDDEGTEASLSR
jgi:hypothetical protein